MVLAYSAFSYPPKGSLIFRYRLRCQTIYEVNRFCVLQGRIYNREKQYIGSIHRKSEISLVTWRYNKAAYSVGRLLFCKLLVPFLSILNELSVTICQLRELQCWEEFKPAECQTRRVGFVGTGFHRLSWLYNPGSGNIQLVLLMY